MLLDVRVLTGCRRRNSHIPVDSRLDLVVSKTMMITMITMMTSSTAINYSYA